MMAELFVVEREVNELGGRSGRYAEVQAAIFFKVRNLKISHYS